MRTNRRSVLFGLGIVSITPLLAWQKPVATEVVTAKPDASRFAYANPSREGCGLANSPVKIAQAP